MRRVTKVETFDGRLHDRPSEATRHLEKLYADKLFRMASVLQTESDFKVTKLRESLDRHLGLVVELQRIKQDLVMDAPGAEDDFD